MSEKLFSYRYPYPALTVDCVIFGFDGRQLQILLIERGIEPYKGLWALPGGFMKMDETVEEAARRELFEETSLTNIYMEQFKVFSKVNRDPRERVVTVAFIALVKPDASILKAGDDASNTLWFEENSLPPLAFDHHEIIVEARKYLTEILRLRPAAFELLNNVFSLSELQRVYEVINRTHYDRRNFQRKAMQSGLIKEVSVPDISPTSCDMDESYDEELCSKSISSQPVYASTPKGRPTLKLFSINNLKKKITKTDTDNADSEGSTRDLFDF